MSNVKIQFSSYVVELDCIKFYDGIRA